ncbi:M48 family metallopeptidase [Brevundimonas sp.]|uniref:M48 family metallopeptidase n=1 Tax=Brevundimonas sp. TaxID=1871086 RepID=UPI002FCB1C29
MSRPDLSRLMAGAASALVLMAASSTVWATQVRAPGEQPAANTAEAGLWGMSEETETYARRRGDRNNDPALNAYVSDLTCRVAGEHCKDIRVYVMDRPVFNAMAMPNGYVEVWSGLMLRASTEDELAFVLGHEVGHFLEEHSFERLRTLKNTSTALLVFSLGAATAGVYYQVDVSALIDAVYLSSMAGYMGYNQSHESQSDQMGLDMVHRLGLDASAGASIWGNVKAETAASSFRRVRNSEASGSAFRTHPLTVERIAALSTQAKALGFSGTDADDRKRYRAIIRPHLAGWIEDEHRHRDFGRLLHLLDRLGADGEDLGLVNYHKGEVYRRRREEGDDLLAVTAYRAAVAHADVPVAAYRELGALEARTGNTGAAREALTQYIRLAPQADDLWIVEEQLSRLEGDKA